MTALAGADKAKPTTSTAAQILDAAIKGETVAIHRIDLTRCKCFLGWPRPDMLSCELIVMLQCLF